MNKIIKDIHIIVYIKLDFFKSVMIYQFRCINRQYPADILLNQQISFQSNLKKNTA